jgi:hypothetical protein
LGALRERTGHCPGSDDEIAEKAFQSEIFDVVQ